MKQACSRIFAFEQYLMILLLYLLATIQFVWYYQSKVPSYLHVFSYEQGKERTPFQARILMMLVLRWAHRNVFLIHVAQFLSTVTPIYRSVILPESLVQATLNLLSMVVCGWVATQIYRHSSPYKLLTPYVYPLVLVMAVTTYVLHAVADFRFYYDLPSLGFFSFGLYLIYFRKPAAWFAALFLVATINRETTLLLLVFYALAAAEERGRMKLKKLYKIEVLGVLVPLLIYWTAWHIIVGRMFAHNHLEWIRHYAVNAVLLAWPPVWPQLLGTGCYVVPLIVLYRSYVTDSTLRLWLWALPAWFGVMFIYGILNETRIYGELIPYLTCMAMLIAEEAIVRHLRRQGWGSKEKFNYSAGNFEEIGLSVSNSLSESACTR